MKSKRILMVSAVLLPLLVLTSTCGEDEKPTEPANGAPISGMVLVPAGTFMMGDGVAYCGQYEHQVTLTRAFYIGQYEVTNKEYRDAVQWAYAQGYVTATSSSVNDALDGSSVELVDLSFANCQLSFSDGTFAVDSGKDDYPMAGLSWYGAAAYCDWLSLQSGLERAYDHSTWECNGGSPYAAAGYRLPTDAEWEYAAQYDDERIYPWGDEPPDCSRANYWYDYPSSTCVGSASAVGSYPAAPASLGLYDMAGNAFEWCNDWHTCYPDTGAVSDPVGPEAGLDRFVRGGSWDSLGGSLRCANRGGWFYPSTAYFGFRCARSQ